MKFCKKNCDCSEMSPDERTALAEKLRARGMGIIVAAVGVLVGLTASLFSTLGAGSAIGIGVGGSFGLFMNGCHTIRASNKMMMSSCEEEEEERDDGVPSAEDPPIDANDDDDDGVVVEEP